MKNNIINAEKLSVKYISQADWVIENISIKISLGERVAIWGPSGCGKTTLVSLINNVLTAKEVLVEHQSLFISDDLRISTVFQTPRLLPWLNIKENILYPLSNVREQYSDAVSKAEEVLKKIQLDKYSSYYPRELSVGMGQRVNMARALIYMPSLIILDEPFSSLDKKSKNIIKLELLDYLNTNKAACIFISHDLQDVLELCETIVVLTEGPSNVKKVLKLKDYKTKESLENAIND